MNGAVRSKRVYILCWSSSNSNISLSLELSWVYAQQTHLFTIATDIDGIVYNFAFGFSCASMASPTFLLWILPVAVLGIKSVKNTFLGTLNLATFSRM
jgi:hypothetical protein